MIRDIDVSVVVQGPVIDKVTGRCLHRIKELLPRSEVIFSTCSRKEEVVSLPCDVLVLNEDPGATLREWHRGSVYNNLNRQIISTVAGINKVSRPYCLKLRSDLFIDNLKFIEYFENLSNENKSDRCYKVFNKKILASLLFTKIAVVKHNSLLPIPFHLSDWWFFGLSSDVCAYLGNTSLVREPDFTNHFNHYVELNPFGTYERFTSEQYIFISFFKKKYPKVDIKDSSILSEEVIDLSVRLIKENFEILNFKNSGIFSLKYKELKDETVLGDLFLCLYSDKQINVNKEKLIMLRLIKHKARYRNTKNYIKSIEEIICIIALQSILFISKIINSIKL